MRTLIEHLSQKENSEIILNSVKGLTVPNVLHAKDSNESNGLRPAHFNTPKSFNLAIWHEKKDFPRWYLSLSSCNNDKLISSIDQLRRNKEFTHF